jgi:antitoxin component of MazEF toxin-antitoxin module
MPILRKIIQVGNAKAVTLPSQWLDWLERETGSEPKEVLMEVDEVLKIIPIVKERKLEQLREELGVLK